MPTCFRSRFGPLMLAPVLISACATPYDRTSRALGSFGRLVYSNSPVVIERREPTQSASGLEVTYSVLLANHERFAVTLVLSQAQVTADKQADTASASCRLGSQAERSDVKLGPGDRGHIQCKLRLTPQGAARLEQGDLDLHLSIPLVTGEGNTDLTFVYALRMEDAL